MISETGIERPADRTPRYVKAVPVSERLAEVIDGMWEWDIPDAAVGRAITGKLLPSVAPQFCVHYGSPLKCDRMSGAGEYLQIAHGIQTKVVTVQPTGSIRAITIRLKPQAAPLFMGPHLSELRDAHVQLGDLFTSSTMSELTERLCYAAGTAERAALIESFLLSRMRHAPPDRTVLQAALRLQNSCTLSVRALASQLYISERQLSRKFTAAFGVGPKQFARLVRITRALELRHRGLHWLDIVSTCGFSDQAHLIKDFNSLIGFAPDNFFRAISARRVCGMNASYRSSLSNQFVVRFDSTRGDRSSPVTGHSPGHT